jgi:hypothetical protein
MRSDSSCSDGLQNYSVQPKENLSMDIGAYFQILIYSLMTVAFVTLVLIFLEMYYGNEEEEQ